MTELVRPDLLEEFDILEVYGSVLIAKRKQPKEAQP